jgi:hypothetical protein
MENKFNLKTNFLYQLPLNRDYMIGGGTDVKKEEWHSRFEDEEIIFGNFLTSCDFKELIEILVVSYAKKHPNFLRIVFELFETLERSDKLCTKYIKPYRTDLIKAVDEIFTGELVDDVLMEYEVYEKSIYFEFTENIPADIVEEALEGLTYEKYTEDTQIIYNVEKSPIATLTLNDNSFKIELNQDYVVQYHKM